MVDGHDERLALVFRESLRSMELQAARAEDLRTRAGALVAASAIATAFLGSQALDAEGTLRMGAVVAVAAFVLIIASCVYVLAPKTGWMFVSSARGLLVEYVEADEPATLDDMHRTLALHCEDNVLAISAGLNRMTRVTQGACILLLVEIAAWLLDVRGRG